MSSRQGLSRPGFHARAYRSIFELALAACVIFTDPLAGGAAEITIGRTVILEGQIESGDYDKLRDFLVAKRAYGDLSDPACFGDYLDGCPESIYLASPGGNVAEAMKIGRLIRTLGWVTTVPTRPSSSEAARPI